MCGWGKWTNTHTIRQTRFKEFIMQINPFIEISSSLLQIDRPVINIISDGDSSSNNDNSRTKSNNNNNGDSNTGALSNDPHTHMTIMATPARSSSRSISQRATSCKQQDVNTLNVMWISHNRNTFKEKRKHSYM